VTLGAAGGSLGPLTSYTVGSTFNALAFGMAVADLDGQPDIVSANRQSQSVSVLLNTGSGTFAPNTAMRPATRPTRWWLPT
jgi:hypothetical protein